MIRILYPLLFYLITSTNGAQLPNIIEVHTDNYNMDLNGCPTLKKHCQQYHDSLEILSCSLNSCWNDTQVSYPCQHRIWIHAKQLLDDEFLTYKLKKPCSEQPPVLECLEKSSQSSIDCLLKKKPAVTGVSCWETINKIESLLFNDWQILKSFLTYCHDDIETNYCGRIPHDPKILSQVDTLKCLQTQDSLVPECQSEITSLKQMKYSTLQLDKIVFAACNMEQKSFCSDELPGSWLMYKCLIRHKNENGMYLKLVPFIFTC